MNDEPKIGRWISIVNLVISILLVISNLMVVKADSQPYGNWGALTLLLSRLITPLYLIFVLGNLVLFIFVLARRLKSLYWMQTIFFILIFVVIAGNFTTGPYGTFIGGLIAAGASFVCAVFALYYSLKKF